MKFEGCILILKLECVSNAMYSHSIPANVIIFSLYYYCVTLIIDNFNGSPNALPLFI